MGKGPAVSRNDNTRNLSLANAKVLGIRYFNTERVQTRLSKLQHSKEHPTVVSSSYKVVLCQ